MVKPKLEAKLSQTIKHDATSQNVYDVAESLMALQEYDVLETIKIDNTTLL